MAVTYLDGLIDVADLPADSRPEAWAKRLLRNHPNAALLQALSTRIKRETVTDPKFHQFELDRWPLKAYLDGAVSDTATTLKVDDGADPSTGTARYFQAGTLVRVGDDPSSGEVLRVISNPVNADQIEVERGYGGTTAAAIPDNTALIIIGHADAEAADSPQGRVRTPTDVYNHVQIFQTPYRYTRLAQATKTNFGETVKAMSHMDALIQHAQEREMAMLYGVRHAEETSTDEGMRYSTGGVTSFISTHVHDGSSTNFTTANFNDWMAAMAGDGSEQKVCLVGKTAYSALWDMVRTEATQTLEPAETKWGFSLKRMITAGPDLMIHLHPLLSEVAPGDMLILDLKYLSFMFVKSYDFKHEAVTLDNNKQVTKYQFYSISGLRMGYEKANGYIKGITTFTEAS